MVLAFLLIVVCSIAFTYIKTSPVPKKAHFFYIFFNFFYIYFEFFGPSFGSSSRLSFRPSFRVQYRNRRRVFPPPVFCVRSHTSRIIYSFLRLLPTRAVPPPIPAAAMSASSSPSLVASPVFVSLPGTTVFVIVNPVWALPSFFVL